MRAILGSTGIVVCMLAWGCEREGDAQPNGNPDADSGGADTDNASGNDGDASSAEYPLLKSLPVELAAINYALLAESADLYDDVGFPLADFGFVIPESSAGAAKSNPQPTFWAPLGTAVRAPVDGVVITVETLYSGDFSIMFGTTGEMSSYMWETEHVIDVLVEPGDAVSAGEPVASVSDYECNYARTAFSNTTFCGTGIGLVELGLLHGGQVPEHVCPFEATYVDPSVVTSIAAELAAARAAIETALEDPDLYDATGWESTDCITLDPIEG